MSIKLPLPVDILFFDHAKPIVVFDVMNTIVNSETIHPRDPYILKLLHTLHNSFYTLVLISMDNESTTRNILGDLMDYFHHAAFKVSPRDVACFGKSQHDMIFVSSNFSQHYKEWHLPLDIPLDDSFLNVFIENSMSDSDPIRSDPLSSYLHFSSPSSQYDKRDCIRKVRTEWNMLRSRYLWQRHQFFKSHNGQTVSPPPHLQVTKMDLWNPPTNSEEQCQAKFIHPSQTSLQFAPIQYSPPREVPLLPPTLKPITVCLDLDGTLIHAIPTSRGLSVNIRPYLRYFLTKLASLKDIFEVVLFSTATKHYSESILLYIDKHKVIDHILHREHCSIVDGRYHVKELSQLRRNCCILIDDNNFSFLPNPKDCIPISCWRKSDKNDDELLGILEVLSNIHEAVCMSLQRYLPTQDELRDLVQRRVAQCLSLKRQNSQ